MQSEVTVILKNEDATFRKQFNCYEIFSLDNSDPVLNKLIDEAKKEWRGTPDEIIINIKSYWFN